MKWTAVVFLMLASLSCYAQQYSNETKMKIENRGSSEERLFRRLIPQAALILSDYRGSDSSRYQNRNGFSIGALLDLGSGYNLVGETGLLFRQLNAASQYGAWNTNYSYNYLSVPIAAKYYFSGQENTSLYVKAGAMGSTQVSQSTTTSAGSAGPVYSVNDQNFEVSALGGIGAKFYISQDTDFIVEGNYSRDVNTIFMTGNGIYNASLNLSAGVTVNL